MEIFEVPVLLERQSELSKLYLEFLRVPDLSVGIYTLEEGASDLQQPHTEDEIYYVISGKGFISVESEERAVQAGSVIYVKARDAHFFHTITEKLVVMVIFAPAEYSRADL